MKMPTIYVYTIHFRYNCLYFSVRKGWDDEINVYFSKCYLTHMCSNCATDFNPLFIKKNWIIFHNNLRRSLVFVTSNSPSNILHVSSFNNFNDLFVFNVRYYNFFSFYLNNLKCHVFFMFLLSKYNKYAISFTVTHYIKYIDTPWK